MAALLESADKHVKSKQLDKAGAALERALRIEPRNAGIWHDLAQIRLHQGQYQQAESLASKSNNLAGGNRALQSRNWKVIASARKAAGNGAGAEEAEARASQFAAEVAHVADFRRGYRRPAGAGWPTGPAGRWIRPAPAATGMAAAVAAILEDGGTLIVEAGTGTGKTFAYLIPALQSGARIIISTGTRHLQDQLFHQDLPVVRRALKLSVQVALLKGRGNYLCRYRLQASRAGGAADFARAGGRVAPHPSLGQAHPPRRHCRNHRCAGILAALAASDLYRG